MLCNHDCVVCGEHEEGDYTPSHCDTLSTASLCFSCHFWQQIADEKQDYFFIKGVCFRACNKDVVGMRGFGGRLFVIEKDGELIYTRNLWTQGPVPEVWRQKLADNAKFVLVDCHCMCLDELT